MAKLTLSSRFWLQCVIGALALGAIHPAAAAAQPKPTAIGLWRVIDEDTHKAISLIEIESVGGRLSGKVRRVMHSDQGTQPKCLACPGERRGAPVVGMTVLWDLKPTESAGAWEGGQVLDPARGKIYRCHLKLLGAERLQVRGFLGISLFGRTQVWERADPQELAADLPSTPPDP